MSARAAYLRVGPPPEPSPEEARSQLWDSVRLLGLFVVLTVVATVLHVSGYGAIIVWIVVGALALITVICAFVALDNWRTVRRSPRSRT